MSYSYMARPKGFTPKSKIDMDAAVYSASGVLAGL
jgi:hypothetical protein